MVQYTESELLEALRTCKEKYGEINTQVMNDDPDLPTWPTYSYRFDSMAAAAEKAGLDEEAKRIRSNRSQRVGYSDDEIRSNIKEIATNGTVTPKEINTADKISASAVRNYLGKPETIIGKEINGVEIVPSHIRRYKDREEIIEIVEDLSDENNVVKRVNLLNEITRGNIKYVFGSVDNLYEELEIKDGRSNVTSSTLLPLFEENDYVYVLTNDRDMYYVGQTSDLRKRLQEHQRDGKWNTVERIYAVPDDKDPIEYEEEISLSLAREKETTEIYGGM